MNKLSIKRKAASLFAALFVKTYFYKFWEHVNNLSLKGMGVGNGADQISSGEKVILQNIFQKYGVTTVFDVGANEGNYSAFIKQNFPDTTIYAFEPHPKTFKVLEATTARFSNIHLFNVAVGNPALEGSEKLKLYDYLNNDGSDHASAVADTFEYSHHTKEVIAHDVDLISLDSFCSSHQISRIDFLKIDTEGFEYEALLGLKDMIYSKRVGLIQWEFNSMNAGRVFFLDFWKILNTHYHIYRLFPNGLLPVKRYDPKFLEIFHLQNYLAVAKDLGKE